MLKMKKLLHLFLLLGIGFLIWLVGVYATPAKEQTQNPATSQNLMHVFYGSNISATGAKQNLSMNIFFPKDRIANKKYPLVMLMHGGGFLNGIKDNMNAACQQLADSGFVAVTINYRKGWNQGADAMACAGDIAGLEKAVYRASQDARAALRFLVEKQKDYSIDTSWLFVGGSSAGAVLALNTVYLTDTYAKSKMVEAAKELGSLNAATNNYTPKYSIKGICNMWGGLPDSTLITKANAVPLIAFHGTNDFVIPYNIGRYGTLCEKYPFIFGSAVVARRVVKSGKPAVLNLSIGGKHGPTEFTQKIIISNTACFFKNVMRGTAKSKIYTDAKAGCR